METGILSGDISHIHWSPDQSFDYDQYASSCRVLGNIEQGHQYWIGDALIFGKLKFGEAYSQVIPIEKAETWRQYEWVCSRVSTEVRRQLSGYSQARIMARLTPERQKALIAEILAASLTTRQLTDEVRRITRTQATEGIKLPEGQFRVVYADPPWQYNDRRDGMIGEYSAPEDHYPTLPLQAICDLPIKSITPGDSVLFLWIPSPLLFTHAPAVIDAWGYEYRSMFVWDKERHNPGNYNSVRHELLLICIRGKCQPALSYTLADSVQTIKVGKRHSEKPEAFRELIDQMYPDGDRVELFARGDLPDRWRKYGNE